MVEEIHLTVREVMSASPIAVDRQITVREAIDVMRNNLLSSLVILPRHSHDEYGLLVVSHIASKVIALNRSPDRTNVYEIMSKPVLTVNADMEVKYAVRLLSRLDLSRALVLDKGELVGIVTMRDMVIGFVRPKNPLPQRVLQLPGA